MNDLDILERLGVVAPADPAVITASALAVRAEAAREGERGGRVASSAMPSPSRHRRWFRHHRAPVAMGTVAAAVAAVVAGVVLGVGTGVVAPAAPRAFAGWTPSPTAPAPGQTSKANTACVAAEDRLATQPPLESEHQGMWRPVADDTRGGYTLVFMAATNPEYDGTCLAGPSGRTIAWVQASTSPAAEPGALAGVGLMGGGKNRFWMATGQAGPGVTGVSFTLTDGTVVTTTVAHGAYAGWWPWTSSPRATIPKSVTVTSAYGVVTQPFPVPGRATTPPPGAPRSPANAAAAP